MIMEKADPYIEMESILANAKKLKAYVEQIKQLKETLKDKDITDVKVRKLNDLSLKLSRCLTWALYTYTDRFEQNSYAYTPATRPIPMLYHAVDLKEMKPDSLEYRLNLTEAMRNRNRVSVAFENAVEYCELYLEIIRV